MSEMQKKTGEGGSDSNSNTDKSGDAQTTLNGSGESTSKAYTQAQLDEMFSDRASRATASAEKAFLKTLGVDSIEDAQKKLSDLSDIESEKLTAQEKLEQLLEDQTTQVATANSRIEELEVQYVEQIKRNAVYAEAAKQGFADPNDAWSLANVEELDVADDNSVGNAGKVVKAVAESKPYLLGSSSKQTSGGTPRKGIRSGLKKKVEPTPTVPRQAHINF